MAKLKPRRIPSDDFVFTIGGEGYKLHEGEWVEVLPGLSVADLRLIQGVNALQDKLAASIGDTDEGVQTVVAMDESASQAIKLLQRRVVGWNWTDDQGEPLPSPVDNPKVFEELQLGELFYLVGLLVGEGPEERKNGSRPSRTSSSGSARPRSRK